MCIQKQYTVLMKNDMSKTLTYFYFMHVILFCFVLKAPLSSSMFPLLLRYGSARAVKPPNSCVRQYAKMLQLLWQNAANRVIINGSTLHFKGTRIPVLALFGSWSLDSRESECFLRGPKTLMEMKNYKHLW